MHLFDSPQNIKHVSHITKNTNQKIEVVVGINVETNTR